MTDEPRDNECLLHDAHAGGWLRVRAPVTTVTARAVADVAAALQDVADRLRRDHLFAAGFLAYEAGPAFDPAVAVRPDNSGFPLLWFGLYRAAESVTLPTAPVDIPLPVWQASVAPATYMAHIARIRDYIRNGDTYQVNYTYRLRTSDMTNPWPLFLSMRRAQACGYGAFLRLPDWDIASASPEVFFELADGRLCSRPMKGTAPRGLWSTQDLARGRALQRSVKNRAENIMIVDMVRNDLGRVALPGSVRTRPLFALEAYPTVWQLTSTVSCRTTAGVPAIMAALFPCASITGAPKVRTTQIIAELETSPRRIYTGTIGFILPDGRAQFNVAIRTVLRDRCTQQAEYGTGGGIVWDSQPQRELTECETKTRVLVRRTPEFDLLETLLWTPDTGWHLQRRHLARLQASARYFGRSLDLAALRRQLGEFARDLPPVAQRVRLTVAASGHATLTATPLTPLPAPYRVRLAPVPIDTADVFLYHKTTRRQTYEQAMAGAAGAADALLCNRQGEFTETTIANLVLERTDGQRVTPPRRCGLLPGVARAALLAAGELREAVIRKEDLRSAQGLYLVNSVRGLWPIVLVP